MTITDFNQKLLSYLLPLEVAKIGIFGSYARNDQHAESDLDLLVDFREKISLLDLIKIEDDLTTLLGIKVDLITEKSVHPELRKYINQDIKYIYG